MRFSSAVGILFVSVLAPSCWHSDEAPEILVTADPVEPIKPKKPDFVAKIAMLDDIAPPGSKLGDAIVDVRHVLEARSLQAQGEGQASLASWRAAMVAGKGGLARVAFDGWVRSYVGTLEEPLSSDVLTKLVLAETQQGKLSAHMRRKKLARSDRLAAYLKKVVPNGIRPSVPIFAASKGKKPSLFEKGDPLLIKSAKKFCKGDLGLRKAFEQESEAFPKWKREYWRGMTQFCLGDYRAAERELESALVFLKTRPSSNNYLLNLYSTLVVIKRRLGHRARAAEVYLELLSAWNKTDLRSRYFFESRAEFFLRMINDYLWAGRYLALTGQLQPAQETVLKGLGLLKKSRIALKGEDYKNAQTYKAEAYHVLSARVMVEKRDYASAINYTQLGLKIRDLDPDWRERFLWYRGLYEFIEGEWSAAVRSWNTLVDEAEEDSLQDRLYFWLAVAYRSSGQKEKAEEYADRLVAEFPVSYYSTVALNRAGFSQGRAWERVFGELGQFDRNLTPSERFDLERMRQHEKVGPMLLRAEILIAANLHEYAQVCVRDLGKAMRRTYAMSDENLPGFVYVSRLEFATDRHLQAISLTHQLDELNAEFWKDWPDQLLVYFPKPFWSTFKKAADQHSVSIERLYALTRQETAFSPDAQSYAGAKGLMQLTPHTAEQFSESTDIDSVTAVEKIMDPQVNVSIGAAYVKHLRVRYKEFVPAVVGAYNAGEYAVNQWLARRHHTNPLVWVELIPFGETKNYVKSVWRNETVYRYISGLDSGLAYVAPMLMKEGGAEKSSPFRERNIPK